MRITSVGFSGFKRAYEPEEVALSGMDVLVGLNGTGKSTVMQAIMVAMLGHNPSWGASNQLTYANRNVSARNMWAGISLDADPREIAFSLTKPEKSIKEQIWIGKEYHPPGRGTELRKEAIGCFPVMFNLSEFLNLTANKRKDFILSLLPGMAADSLITLELSIAERFLGKEVFDTLKEFASDDEHLLVLAQGKCGKLFKKFSKAVIVKPGNDPMLQKMPEMGVIADAARRFFLDKRSELRGSKESLREVGATDFITPEELARLRKELEEVEGRAEALQKKYGEAEEAQRQYNDREKMLLSLDEKQGNQKRVMDDAAGDFTDRDGMGRRLGELDDDIAALVRSQASEGAIGSRLKGLDAVLETAASGGECPVCRHDLSSEDVVALRAELAGKARTSEEMADDLNVRLRAREDERRELLPRIERHDTAEKARAGFLKTLQEMKAISPDFPDSGQIADETRRLKEKRDALKKELEEKAAAAEAAKFRAKLEETIAGLEESLGYYKAADEACKDLAMLPLKTNVGKIQTMISSLLSSIDEKLEFVFELDAKDKLLLGLRRDEIVIPFSALSGGEQVIVGTALVVGLITMAGPPLKVLAVEASEVDHVRIQALLRGLMVLKDRLDNVLVATHINVGSPEGWEVHYMGEEGELMESEGRLLFVVHETGSLIEKASMEQMERTDKASALLIFPDTPGGRVKLLSAAVGAGAGLEFVAAQAKKWDIPFKVGTVKSPEADDPDSDFEVVDESGAASSEAVPETPEAGKLGESETPTV